MPMLHSMTAFASRTGADANCSWVLELRGVNAKGLDIRLRLPDQMSALEKAIRERLQKRFARGNISVSLRLEQAAGATSVRIDEDMVEAYIAAAMKVRTIAKTKGLKLKPSKPTDVLSLRGVISSNELDLADIPTDPILVDVDSAVDAFADMRATEGAELARVMTQQLNQIEALVTDATGLTQARKEEQAAKLRENLAFMLKDLADANPDRIAQELALLVVKSDITEELDRLGAHISAARELLKTKGPVGRKLDFLMQEFNREANTLCAKAQSAKLTQVGLDLKTLIDQMREQVQNVE